jgi:hypothetical protein
MSGACGTANVNDCVAFEPTPFAAVKVMLNTPPVVGVPLSVPDPLWLSMNDTPVGSAPLSLRLGVGYPVAVTVNEPATPAVNVVLFALVIAGA